MRIDEIGIYQRETISPGQPVRDIASDELRLIHDGKVYIYERPVNATDAEIAQALGVAFDVETVEHNQNGFWID